MFTCPHCKAPGLGFFAKALSSAAGPARCEACGRLSYASDALALYSSALAPILLAAAIAAAIHFWSWWPFAILAAIPVLTLAVSLALPLRATTAAQAKRARVLQVVGVALLVLGTVAVGLLS